jgi:capsular polysaccharide biosynthesis protein
MCYEKVFVRSPLNVKKKDLVYSNKSYELSKLKVLSINNVDFTHNGIGFKNNKIIRQTVQAYPDKKRIFELEGQIQLRNNPIELYFDNNKYLLVHHPWLNYYHWLTEAIPRIWLVNNILDTLILLLPEYYKNIEFVQDSLKPFKFKKIVYVPSGFNMKIKKAVIPQIKPICSSYYPKVLFELRNLYIEYAKGLNLQIADLGERVYIMRGNSFRRRIVNEIDLIDNLKKHGFRAVDTSSFSFFEQVLFSKKLKYLISNGSGLTNMHFMNPGSTVIELQKRITNENDFHDKVLWHFASALNLNYCFFVSSPVDKNDDIYTANLIINVTKFEKLLNKVLRDTYTH